ncbi:cyclic-di-AMP receptor, partial [Bacillus altitudinis]|uniref:cyclic-di-AMP receptor n=1 Tax=Bacillus altitudinis TaxID=293387 RepID=UPI003B518D83
MPNPSYNIHQHIPISPLPKINHPNQIKLILPLLHHQHTTNLFKIFTQHQFPLTKLPSTPPFLNSPNTTFIIPSHHLPLHKPLHL